MRTKTLLLTAAIAAAGLTSSMAQVYSVNAVGYINLTIPSGFSIIANQLNASLNGTPNNSVGVVLGAPPSDVTLYTIDVNTGNFLINSWSSQFQGWDDDAQPVPPGTGLFVFNAGAPFNITLVGEVPQGTLNTPLRAGFNLVGSQVPQAGLMQTELGYTPTTTPGTGDTVYRYVNSTGSYLIYNWSADFGGGWDEEPTVNVGEGVYLFRGGNSTWNRTFSVN